MTAPVLACVALLAISVAALVPAGEAAPASASHADQPGPSAGAPLAQADGPTLEHRYELVDTWDAELPTVADRPFHPEGLDMSPWGVVAVAERGNHLVSLWYPDGECLGRWGERGGAPGRFEAPEDVAFGPSLDEPRLYVADTGNRRVQVLDGRTGAFLAEWTDVGLPRGIAVDADGRVFVSDTDNDVVRVFGGDGTPSGVWGSPGSGPGRLADPLGLQVGPDGLLYVADHGNQRVQWFDPLGIAQGVLDVDNRSAPGGAPLDVGLAETGDLYVAVDRGVLRYRGRATYQETIVPFQEEPTTGCPPGRCCVELVPMSDHHEGVRRLAVTENGGLLFSYAPSLRWKDRITYLPRRGYDTHWPRCGTPENTHATDPKAIDAGRDPYIHVLDTSSNLHVYKPDGTLYNRQIGVPAGTGDDLSAGAIRYGDAVGPNHPRTYTAVITGNQVDFHGVHKEGCAVCANPVVCPPEESIGVLPSAVITEDLAAGKVHWNRALSLNECGRALAVLDSGAAELVVRQYLDDYEGRPPQFATPAPAGLHLGSRQLEANAYSDLEFDRDDVLWVLTRSGVLQSFAPTGQAGPEVELEGLAGRAAEALAVHAGASSFVLTADEWIFEHDGAGRPLAAWSITELAGPGRYEDIAVDAGGRVLVTDGENDRVLVFERSDRPPDPLPGPERGACAVSVDKTAAPGVLPLGATTDVTLRLAGDCGVQRDIVVVVDGSCQMTGERMVGARNGALRLAQALDPTRDRMALVTFTDAHGGARLRAALGTDRESLLQASATLPTECLPGRGREGRVSDGLRAGREALFGPAGRPGAEKILVLVTASIFDAAAIERRLAGRDSPRVTDREHVLYEARQLWEAGARVVTVAVGPDAISRRHEPDRGLLAAVALPASQSHYAAPGAVPAVFGALAEELGRDVLFERLEIVDRLPGNMRLIVGSVSPPAAVAPDGSLVWTFSDVPAASGVPDLTYRLEPQAAGLWPTNIEASATYTDGLGSPGRRVFPVPVVEVIAPTETATSSPAATPTATTSPTATATPTATPTPTCTSTASPTPVPEPVYLPVAHRQRCKPSQTPFDVVLAIDTSSSMTGDKLHAAAEAARGFVSLLDLPLDHAAVVAFDREARLLQGLTGDRAAVGRALASLETQVGTRIDLALWLALDAVAGPDGRPGVDGVIVLLTDGQAQGGTEADIEMAAQVADDLGVTRYAIGLGADVNPAMLARIAGSTERVYLAPEAADLARIYAEIARLIPCR